MRETGQQQDSKPNFSCNFSLTPIVLEGICQGSPRGQPNPPCPLSLGAPAVLQPDGASYRSLIGQDKTPNARNRLLTDASSLYPLESP